MTETPFCFLAALCGSPHSFTILWGQSHCTDTLPGRSQGSPIAHGAEGPSPLSCPPLAPMSWVHSRGVAWGEACSSFFKSQNYVKMSGARCNFGKSSGINLRQLLLPHLTPCAGFPGHTWQGGSSSPVSSMRFQCAVHYDHCRQKLAEILGFG